LQISKNWPCLVEVGPILNEYPDTAVGSNNVRMADYSGPMLLARAGAGLWKENSQV